MQLAGNFFFKLINVINKCLKKLDMFICEWNKIINGRNFDRTERAKSPVLERGADGKLRPKKKKININDLDADTLRKLGIDPNLSKKEIAKKLKVLKNYIEPFRLGCYDGQTV